MGGLLGCVKEVCVMGREKASDRESADCRGGAACHLRASRWVVYCMLLCDTCFWLCTGVEGVVYCMLLCDTCFWLCTGVEGIWGLAAWGLGNFLTSGGPG